MYIPTALSAREATALSRYAKGKIVTEAGALLGFSTIQLAKTAKHVTSIDRHTGYNYWKNDTLKQFCRNLGVSGVEGKVAAIEGDFSIMVGYPADFAFIDLDGMEGTTLKAIELANAPVIGVHDFDRTSCRGVAYAVKASGLEIIERVDSLVILGKPWLRKS